MTDRHDWKMRGYIFRAASAGSENARSENDGPYSRGYKISICTDWNLREENAGPRIYNTELGHLSRRRATVTSA